MGATLVTIKGMDVVAVGRVVVEDLDIAGGEGRLPRIDQAWGSTGRSKVTSKPVGLDATPVDREGPAREESPVRADASADRERPVADRLEPVETRLAD